MEAFFLAVVMGALGETGDKTQVLTALLAARFKRPTPIVLGLLVSTLANYAIAGLLGKWIGTVISPQWLRWGGGLLFLAIAILTLKSDELGESLPIDRRHGVFVITVLSTFLAEMGDKTQLATVALAARFGSVTPVVAGMTLGVIAADTLVIVVANTVAMKARLRGIRFIAAGLFAVLGLATLMGVWTR